MNLDIIVEVICRALGDDYYEDLDGPAMVALLDQLARGETPTPGSQTGRKGSCPATVPTTLTNLPSLSVSAVRATGVDD